VVLGARRLDRLDTVVAEHAGEGSAGRALHGRVAVLVNNAGMMPASTLGALHVDEWNQMIDVNLRGTLHGIAAVLPQIEEQGRSNWRWGRLFHRVRARYGIAASHFAQVWTIFHFEVNRELRSRLFRQQR